METAVPKPNNDWRTESDGTGWRLKSPDGCVDILVREVRTVNGMKYNCTALRSETPYSGRKRQVGSKLADTETEVAQTAETLYEEVSR